MTMHPSKVKCWICRKELPIEEVKYHTAINEERPVKVFCGAECSLKYYEEKKREIIFLIFFIQLKKRAGAN